MKVTLVYLALAVAIAGLLAYVGPAHEIWALRSHGVTTSGTVAMLTCADHSTVRYRFTVSGRSYGGRGEHAEKSCPAATVGETVTVYFLPETPEVNTLREPRHQWKNEVVSIASAALLAPAFIVWAFRRRYRDAA